jgi:tRNA(Ile)-lysidine synthetase-like protein
MTIPLSDSLVPFEGIVRNFLLQLRLLPSSRGPSPFEEWAVGLSGGGDSIFLLHLLLRNRHPDIRILLLHFDHHTESARNLSDRFFVSELAQSLDLPLLIGESPSSEKDRPEASETLLRRERQHFFSQYLRQNRKSALFLGHQADDRIETILANIFQGGGPRSLVGIAPSSGERIYRPILTIKRDEIRKALDLAGFPYLMDPTNDDPAHLRNRIRFQLRPLIDRFFPNGGTHHLEHLATLMEGELVSSPPGNSALLCEVEERGYLRFSLSLYRSLRPSSQGLLIRALMNRQLELGLPVPPERNLLRTLERISLDTEKPFPLGHGWAVNVVLGRVDLVYQYTTHWTQDVEIPKEEGEVLEVRLPRGGLMRILRLISGKARLQHSGHSGRMACLLPLPGPLQGNRSGKEGTRITYWSPGLKILPEKADKEIRLVSSLWDSRKIPAVRRQRWPILCRGEFAFWMPGLLDRTSSLAPEKGEANCLLTYQERERSEWKKFLGNP